FGSDPYLKRNRPAAIVCLPLTVGTELVGLVYLENALTRGIFKPDSLGLVEIITAQIGISLLNATLYERLERNVAQRTEAVVAANSELEELAITLETLGDIGQEITAQLAIDDVLRTLERHAATLIAGSVFSIYRAASSGSKLELAFGRSDEAELISLDDA